MQKVINVLAVLSFLGTATIIGGGTYIFFQRETIVNRIKTQATTAATEAIADALPGLIDAAMPELPNATGGAIAPTGGAALPF
tara:strand:+ start:1472 stop:1720 length:249 start_codon:yes stop_codon:yes gene_type:complete